MDYPIVISPLSEEDGGGYLAKAPDLSGCMSDGETPEEAAANICDAIENWIAESKSIGRAIPEPRSVVERYLAAREKFISSFVQMVDRYDELDGRIEEIKAELQDLMEKTDSQGAWLRFSEITDVAPDGNQEHDWSKTHSREIC